jgi:hypothetical protein
MQRAPGADNRNLTTLGNIGGEGSNQSGAGGTT